MKLKRKWLFIIVGLLVIINLGIFLVKTNVDIHPTIVYVTSQQKDSNLDFMQKVILDGDTANKATFMLVGPTSSKYESMVKNYDIKSTTALLVLNSNNHILSKVQGPDADRIKKEIDKYTK